jgi:hypothetical protein
MPPFMFFFHSTNYIKRKKGGECPPFVFFFAILIAVGRGGAMAPMCFFHNTSYIKRKRGEAMPPPLRLFHNNGDDRTKRGVTMSFLCSFS